MHRLKILLLVVLNTHHATQLPRKCCDAHSYLRRNDSVCAKDLEQRLQIFTNDTDFAKKATDGTCLDAYRNVTEYTYRNGSVVAEKPVDVNFYSKCCPLGHFYDSATHSCVEAGDVDHSFITQNFVRVGLPHCRVVKDYRLERGQYTMELGNLLLDHNLRFQEGQFCIDRDEEGGLVARGCYEDLAVCYDSIRCLHKCCPDGQSFVGGQKCLNTYTHGLNLSFTDRVNNSQDPFAIIHNYNCRIYILKKKIQFYVDPQGVFHAFFNKTNSFRDFSLEDKSYCIEHVQKGKLDNFEFFMCFPDDPMPGKFVAARWAKILSCVFIVLTIAVYLFLPEMLNLFGKILLSYCASMLAIFVLLTYAQFEREGSDQACVITSFLSSYMSLASFSWLNVMCFNIWWTFGTPKSFFTSTQRRSELRRFLLYNIYGWGLPAFLTLLTYLAYNVPNTPYVVKPFLGHYKCFWEKRDGNYAMFLYYVTPLLLMEIANLVLFALTILYCLRVKGEINRMNDNRMSVKERKKSYNIDKEQYDDDILFLIEVKSGCGCRLLLILKLCVTMGISFAFEVVSSLFTFSANTVTQYVEIVWDTVNCLQGVFIFIIFIMKMKVYRLCRNRIVATTNRKISVSSLPTTGTQVSEPLNSKSKIRNV